MDIHRTNIKPPKNVCLNLSLRQADRIVTQIYNQYLGKCGLTGSQFSIFRALDVLKSGTSQDIQRLLILDQTTLSRNLKRLINDGYILVNEDKEDRRRKNLQLSAKGKSLYLKAGKHWNEAQTELKRRLGPELSKQILELSQTITSLLT